MNYFWCVIGNFDGAEAIFQECITQNIYQYHKSTFQKGPVGSVKAGDVLILTYGKQLRGYGIADGIAELGNNGHDSEWYAIPVRDGWKLLTEPAPLPYGVFGKTIEGTKHSIVKLLDAAWGAGVFFRVKSLLREYMEEMGFPVHLSELAEGFNGHSASKPFYCIPEIQRGFVWNATRCEVLWDSILRGIPIGAISLRPTEDGRWEIFDGQQRTNAVALGYADWEKNAKAEKSYPILWIDLAPGEKTKGRKFVFRVTTPPHPWGYHLSNDEKGNNRLAAWEQRQAVDALSGNWNNSSKKGARPRTDELYPVDAILPVPFTVLRQYVEDRSGDDINFYGFIQYCQSSFPNVAWLARVQEDAEVPAWNEIVKAIGGLKDYVVVALNGRTINPKDLGLYFRRMNTLGMEPDPEEIRYSMLKSRISGLKVLDEMTKNLQGQTRVAWLADIAVRFWLSRRDGWKWHRNVSDADIASFGNQDVRDAFRNFVSVDFPALMERFEAVMTGDKDNGLLSWHLSELYRHGRGDCLVLYFLRELDMDKPTDKFIGLATTVLWFGQEPAKCAESLWDASTVQDGLSRSIRKGWLTRWFDIDEVRDWARTVSEKIESDAWGNGDAVVQDPWIGQALSRVWNGFNGGAACSLLLFACRKFVLECFGNYKASDSEWSEQNRPWDYDHILPKAWVSSRRVSDYSYLVRKFLWSIGNSAPLPFSLNRGKNANAPNDYPDPEGGAYLAKMLHVTRQDVNQFGKEEYDLLDKNKGASQRFIRTTLNRMVSILEDWYVNCGIGQLVDFSECREDKRKALLSDILEQLKQNSTFSSATGVWFVGESGQYTIRKDIDWGRPWLACGVCGTITRDAKQIGCMLAVASDGTKCELGIRRHPMGNEIPGGIWWLDDDCETLDNIDIVSPLDVVNKMETLAKTFQFLPEKKPDPAPSLSC